MLDLFAKHLQKLEVALLKRSSMANLAEWIEKETTLAGEPFSYVDHEFQIPILSDTSREVNVRKCSQVGVSESSARLALAMVNVVNPMTVIYTLPTAHFSATFMKTRMDPIIHGSRIMKDNLHATNDNSELKQFNDSFLYVRGAASNNAPISIPADAIISDETDFSDQEVLSKYASRLTHSKWKIIRKFSTPTLPGFGVDKAFQASRRFFNLCKCNHCNHWFLPDYYKHVKIPGFNEDLRTLTKYILSKVRWQDAVLVCPACGKQPSLQVQHREYVLENPDDDFVGAGYQVSPFDAPNIIRIADLVKSSTDYSRLQDFVNFGLGLPMEDSEATLMRSDLEHLFTDMLPTSGVTYVMGVDVGNLYHFMVAAVNGYDEMCIVHAEQVPMGKARQRYNDLKREWRVVCTVMDSNPHSETVMALQEQDSTLYAAVYMKSKSIQTHNVTDKPKEDAEGESFLRQVNINRSKALDGYMAYLRENHLTFKDGPDKEIIIAHHTSMKRVKVYDNDSGELSYSWQKTDGEDHFHHTGLYTWIAMKIRGVAAPAIIFNPFKVAKIKLPNGL